MILYHLVMDGVFSKGGTYIYHPINTYDYSVIITPIENIWDKLGKVKVEIYPNCFVVYCSGDVTSKPKFKATLIS